MFDRLMPWLSGNPLFAPSLALGVLLLLWRGGFRGRLFLLTLGVVLLLGDNGLINPLKIAFQRPRPFLDLADVRLLVGRGGSGSFPSSHASSWFAALVIAMAFYPRSWRWMLPTAIGVSVSRVYVGAHYPSDVLAGAVLGGGYATALLWLLGKGWHWVSHSWIPELQFRLPGLFPPYPKDHANPSGVSVAPTPLSNAAWLQLGYLLIALVLMGRLLYLASGKIELSEDEAYQWLWSKHLAPSYYSKPPMVAYLQLVGTSLWGDRMFGVRFCAPVIGAALSLLVLRFLSRTLGAAQPAFWLMLLLNVIPILAVGATLLTVDPPLVLFWMAAMVVGWRAVHPEGTTLQWALTGLLIGISALSKYSGLYQLLCWVLLFIAWPASRLHLRRPGPWLGLIVCGLCLVPVLIWNFQHDWVTLDHVRFNASRQEPWQPTLRYFWDFLGAEALLLNPVLFLGLIPALVGFRGIKHRPDLARFFFWMGAPVFLGYLGFTLYKRVFPNWIAPAILPLACLETLYWYDRWLNGSRWLRPFIVAALGVGLPLVVILHDTRLVGRLTGRPLPVELDPLRRVQGWKELAGIVEKARQDLLKEGLPVFVVANHYGLVGQISFYIPEARKAAKNDPFVYYKTAATPENQFYFWPGYRGQRAGQNAIFIQEVDIPESAATPVDSSTLRPLEQVEPSSITREFQSVKSVGVYPIYHRDHVVRWMQLFACRNLL